MTDEQRRQRVEGAGQLSSEHLLQDASDDTAGGRAETFMELGRMTAVVAHEIRNPLAGVSGALQVIGDRLPSTAVESAIFDEVQERLADLNRLVEQLVLLSRLDAPVPGRAPLCALLRDAPEAAGRALGRPAPVLEIRGPAGDIALAGEHRMLLSMLGFVLAVAVDAQGPRPEALADEIGALRRVVPVSVEQRGDDCCVVVDSGPAIAEAERAAAFEPFATVGGRSVGLALVIARRIARLHDGELAIEATPEKTTLTLHLPVSPSP